MKTHLALLAVFGAFSFFPDRCLSETFIFSGGCDNSSVWGCCTHDSTDFNLVTTNWSDGPQIGTCSEYIPGREDEAIVAGNGEVEISNYYQSIGRLRNFGSVQVLTANSTNFEGRLGVHLGFENDGQINFQNDHTNLWGNARLINRGTVEANQLNLWSGATNQGTMRVGSLHALDIDSSETPYLENSAGGSIILTRNSLSNGYLGMSSGPLVNRGAIICENELPDGCYITGSYVDNQGQVSANYRTTLQAAALSPGQYFNHRNATFEIASGSSLTFSGLTNRFFAPISFSNAGVVQFYGTSEFNGDIEIPGTVQSSGTSPGNIRINGELAIGSISPSRLNFYRQYASGPAKLRINGNASLLSSAIRGVNLVNLGELQLSGLISLNSSSNVRTVIDNSGVLTLSDASLINSDSIAYPPFFLKNSGRLVVNGPNSSDISNGEIKNSGTVEIVNTDLSLSPLSSFSQTSEGELLCRSVFSLSGVCSLTPAGRITLYGLARSLVDRLILGQGGQIRGSGVVSGKIQLLGGQIYPSSSDGALTFSQSVALDRNSSVEIDINGTEPADHDTLTIGSTAVLGGELKLLTAFTPAEEVEIPIVSYANARLNFDKITGQNLSGDLFWAVSQSNVGINVRAKRFAALQAVPNQSLRIGERLMLRVSALTPNNPTPYEVGGAADWTALSPSILSVTRDGWAQARRAGVAQVRATFKGESITFSVRVTPRQLSSGLSRASLAENGDDAQGLSLSPSVSRDGRYLIYSSRANNLATEKSTLHDFYKFPTVAPEALSSQIVLHDLAGGAQEYISRSTTLPGDGDSILPSISSDGCHVAYLTRASNLLGTQNASHTYQLVTYNRETLKTTPASINDELTAAGNGVAEQRPWISKGGTQVAFASISSDLVTGDSNGKIDLFVRDLQQQTTTRLTVTPEGVESNGDMTSFALSDSGRFVVISTYANNLVAGDTNSRSDVLLLDRDADENGIFDDHPASFERINLRVDGSQSVEASGATQEVAISGDGRFVVFSTKATGLAVNDPDSYRDIYLYDRTARSLRLISIAPNGVRDSRDSDSPSISYDGRFVSFNSKARLGYPYYPGFSQSFRVDRLTNVVERLSQTATSAAGDGASPTGNPPVVSEDGSVSIFASAALNLDPRNRTFEEDIFVSRTELPRGVRTNACRRDEAASSVIAECNGADC